MTTLSPPKIISENDVADRADAGAKRGFKVACIAKQV